MINPKEIITRAGQRASEWRAKQEVEEATIEARRAQEKLERERQEEIFEQAKPLLTETARQIHKARFQPLQEILNHFVEPMKVIRNKYFPDSLIFITDRYEDTYQAKPEFYPNIYHRALMMLEKKPVPFDESLKVLAIHAVAMEWPQKRFGIWGSPEKPKPEYSVFVAEHWLGDSLWRDFLNRAQSVTEDLQSVTPEEDVFEVRDLGQEGTLFRSYYSTSLSIHREGLFGLLIPFRENPKTFAAIEARLVEILTRVEIWTPKEKSAPQV